MSWDELCPNGAIRYYEGDDPDGFAAEVKAEFGLDVTEKGDDGYQRWTWDEWLEHEGERFQSFSFFIPAGFVEAIYGSQRWPLGS
jgi:hypothetical protein